MDAIRDLLQKPLTAGILGAIIGLIIGLLIGWVFWPVEYTGAGLVDLRPEEQVAYLRTAIDAFGYTRDVDQARARYAALGENADEVLAAIAANPAGQDPEVIRDFSAVVQAGPVMTQTPEGVAPPVTTEEEAATGGGFLAGIWPVMCFLVLVIAAIGIVYFIMRSRSGGVAAPSTPAQQAALAARDVERTDYTTTESGPPIDQFIASYKLGDDLFNDSFAINSPSGEYLGECGVEISETIGVGEPKKVTAFEAWLFDKDDIPTVTKVIMSSHAFSDPAIRQRLEVRGEPVLAEPGSSTVLETQMLRMIVRIIDMGYGEGAMPDDSFFDRFIVELAIWQRAA